MPFTAVEEQNYKTQFSALAQDCGLDTSGAPLVQSWNPDDPATLESMRRALAQLRQTVLHPELGPGRIRGLAQRNKPLRTIDEVLEAMIEQTEYAIKADQRQRLNNKIRRGQLFENSPRVREALAIWEEALEEARDGAWAAAVRFAERKRLGPFAAERPDRIGREKALAAMLRAGHPMDLARRLVDAAPGAVPDGE